MVKINAKAVIFDMDGVLVNTEPAIRRACIEALKDYGVNAKPEDFVPFTGMGEDAFIGGVAELYGVKYQTEMKVRAYDIYDEIAQSDVILFDSIKETVLKLRKNHRVAVASAADLRKVKINLRCLGMSVDDFDAVVTGSDVTNKKPDPEIFLKAAEKIGVAPKDCLVIEDALSGVTAAMRAGMQAIGVLGTFAGADLISHGAALTVDDTKNILAHII
ncbi:MAG: HAD family hydrolase [Clostridiales bacterium]|nr:HAD family hydrolase [Clostridiales bacterium]